MYLLFAISQYDHDTGVTQVRTLGLEESITNGGWFGAVMDSRECSKEAALVTFLMPLRHGVTSAKPDPHVTRLQEQARGRTRGRRRLAPGSILSMASANLLALLFLELRYHPDPRFLSAHSLYVVLKWSLMDPRSLLNSVEDLNI